MMEEGVNMPVKKFRKKPVEIEAIRWTGNNLKEVLEFTGKHPGWKEWFSSFEEYERHVKGKGGVFKIMTIKGSMNAKPGDWIIRGAKGEFYPCKPYLFSEIYDEVVPESKITDIEKNVPHVAINCGATVCEPPEPKKNEELADPIKSMEEKKDRHTSGPWKVGKCLAMTRGEWLIHFDAGDRGGGISIATTSGTGNDIHNAWLMAAAPEMLEALILAEQFIDNGVESGYIVMPKENDPAIETLSKIRAVIKKARGIK